VTSEIFEQIATENLILMATVGSGAHGVAIEGTDDHDEMGICIEPPDYVIGLRRFEQWVYRTQPEGVRSGAGDIDRVVYSLRKWTSLALKGNPTVLLLLFATPSLETELGLELRERREIFATRRAGLAFLGYLTTQKRRLLGEIGQKGVKRPELVEKHGFDTKFAMHMLRLGLQGVEYLRSGFILLPMAMPEREYLLAVRRGEVELNEIVSRCAELERELDDLISTGQAPAKPKVAEPSPVIDLMAALRASAEGAKAKPKARTKAAA